jgi:prepilin-type N-terminal cleavage/methylation domain-containing protein
MKKARVSSKVGKALQGSSGGFTLIEVVIAIALIALIGVAVLSALNTASLALIIADQRATAQSLARSQMEYAKNQGYISNNSTLGQVTYQELGTADIPVGYSIWSYDRTEELVPSLIGVPWVTNTSQPYLPADKDNNIQRIKLVIKHDSQILVTLEDYKRNPEIPV